VIWWLPWKADHPFATQVLKRVAIPDELIPADAHVEIDAKMFAGYYVPEDKKDEVTEDLVKQAKGRGLND